MRPDQIEAFNENMIKNFSMDNLLDYLTILDSDKIINSVEKIIKTIQRELQMVLSSNITLGLYIHISCLIERLIINKTVAPYDKLDELQQKHQDFIAVIRKSFAEVERIYNVSIPLSEIGYLYEYIALGSVEKEENSVEDETGYFE